MKISLASYQLLTEILLGTNIMINIQFCYLKLDRLQFSLFYTQNDMMEKLQNERSKCTVTYFIYCTWYIILYLQVHFTLRKHAYSNIWKISPSKTENFQIKISDIFHISAQNIDCGYSLEPPRRGGSNEYPQSMFYAVIRKIMYTPVNPSFTV